MIAIISILANHSVEGVDVKDVLLTLFALLVIGVGAWAVKVWGIPSPISWIIYFVLGAVAFVIAWRFLQGL